ERFRTRQRSDAVDRLEAVFGTAEAAESALGLPAPSRPEDRPESTASDDELAPGLRQAIQSGEALAAKGERVLASANEEDADERRAMLSAPRTAIDRRDEGAIRATMREVEDLVFYLEDAS